MQGIQLNIQLINKTFYFFIGIAFVTAIYNAYMAWFKDESSSFILILSLIFLLIASFLKIYINKQKAQ
jgi:hypothetical protein